MFTIKNAVKNIYRYKSKYKLFGVLYFILILAASVCANIFIQSSALTDNLRRDYYGTVARFFEEPKNRLPRYTREDFLSLTSIECIDDIRFYKYNFATHYITIDDDDLAINALEIELNINDKIIPLSGNDILYGHRWLSDNELSFKSVFVLGYNTSLPLLNFASGEFYLESGRMFERDGEAVISKNYLSAEDTDTWNRLDLGDTIVIKNDNGIYKEFTVVGIQAQFPDDDEATHRRMIYTTLESAEYFRELTLAEWNYIKHPIADSIISGRGMEGPIFQVGNARISGITFINDPRYQIMMGYEVLVYLDSYENYYGLQTELESIYPEDRIYLVFFENFHAIRDFINISWTLSLTFIIFIAVILIIITTISTMILMNNRKYEIAVLRSAGMKKSRVIVNYLIENLAFIWGLTLIALITAQFISWIFAGMIFRGIQDLLSPEVFKQLTQGINLNLLVQNIGLIFGGTTIIVMMSLILACINIIRFEPLKIFNKQY